jgi:hypothetical protein
VRLRSPRLVAISDPLLMPGAESGRRTPLPTPGGNLRPAPDARGPTPPAGWPPAPSLAAPLYARLWLRAQQHPYPRPAARRSWQALALVSAVPMKYPSLPSPLHLDSLYLRSEIGSNRGSNAVRLAPSMACFGVQACF